MVFHSVALLLMLAQAAPPRAQTPPVPKDADAAALARGWNALASGQYDAAVKAADGVLQRRPWDQPAHVLRIHALANISPDRGLDAYEQWLKRGHAEDAAMLEPVAVAMLQGIASGPKPELHEPALRALLLARVAGAHEALAGARTSEQAQIDLDLDAARRGDAAAIQRL